MFLYIVKIEEANEHSITDSFWTDEQAARNRAAILWNAENGKSYADVVTVAKVTTDVVARRSEYILELEFDNPHVGERSCQCGSGEPWSTCSGDPNVANPIYCG
jgi:hypothetical protein